MSEGLEKLRSIGAQRIHEQTHIAHKYVQALLHESFEGMQKVQLLGFISIMEREYGVDLTPLRQSAIEYFEVIQEPLMEEEPSYKKELLVSSKNDKKKFYIFLGIFVLLVVVGMFYFFSQEEPSSEKMNTKVSLPIESSMHPAVLLENNDTNKTDKTAATIDNNTSNTVQIRPHTLTIIPKTKVWVGIIDLDTGKKRQKVISRPLELNASKNYLLSFGHGYIDMEVDDNKTSFKDPQSIKFLYKEGVLKKIGISEFKEYNKGKLW